MDKNELKALLVKNERSQRWLARKLNVSSMLVSMWCSGQRNITKPAEIKVWLT
tara:strand:- start:85 stop:243 length:159 start_codon:yes stop_codon:yes gene_type:complete